LAGLFGKEAGVVQSPRPVEGGIDQGRRRFLLLITGFGALWAAVVASFPIFKFLSHKPQGDVFGKEGRARVEKALPADVARPGMGRNAAYGGRGLIIFRNSAGQLKAFDAKCTHAGCNVGFAGDKLFCTCHGGTYDFEGRNVAGPPPRPLTELKVIEDNGALYVAPLTKSAG
jgi:Rieske Fe-S protein